MREKTIGDLLNGEYREYAEYVVKGRAIPSNVDGLKPVQRKIIFYMLESNGKKKIAEIGGSLSSYNYHHGENNGMDAAIGMAAKWSNNLPLLEGHGNFGSPLVPDASAPRYIFAEQSKILKHLFKDMDLCPSSEDPEDPEPKYYLPIIPYALVNGISGVAVGFATNILPRSPQDVVDQCLAALAGKPVKNPRVVLPSYEGVVTPTDQPNQYEYRGVFDWEKNKNIVVYQPAPNLTARLKYAEFLQSLEEKKIISDFEDHCSKDGFEFKIILNAEQREAIKKKDINKVLRITTTDTENRVLIDDMRASDSYVYIPESTEKYIEDFVKFRLGVYEQRLAKQIADMKDQIDFKKEKRRFVRLILDGSISMEHLSVSRQESLALLQTTFAFKEEYAVKFVALAIYNLNQDSIEELEDDISDCEKKLTGLLQTNPKDLYRDELKTLSGEIKKVMK